MKRSAEFWRGADWQWVHGATRAHIAEELAAAEAREAFPIPDTLPEVPEAREAGERDYLGEARQAAIELANKLAQQKIAAGEVIAAAKAALTEANDAICGITGLKNMAKQVAIAFSAINLGFKAIAAWEASDAK